MTVILLGLGCLILVVITYDFAFTTISANKTGPVSLGVAEGIWRVLSLFSKLPGQSLNPRLTGPLIMCGVAFVWIAMTSIGWLLVFKSVDGALVTKATGVQASWAQTYAFVGNALSTAGASNVQPSDTLWDNLAALTAVNGMIELTLSVTFVLNITQTVVSGRGFLALIQIQELADPASDNVLLPKLTDLCVRLNASPLALYYSSYRPERRLPQKLTQLAHRMATYPDRFDPYRTALSELPYLNVSKNHDNAEFLAEMSKWSGQYTLHP
ncbi:hypothetical protein [Roseibium sp.]|uniref:hypothetical protein n=1 Tax=Roseibium sp. TaxID=1936156 RepID=UPI003A97CAA3